MRQRYFMDVFGQSGDITPDVPIVDPGDGTVSYQLGFPINYTYNIQTNPAAKAPTRIQFNSLFNDFTATLQQYQQNGIPEFITAANAGGSAFSYGIGAVVLWSSSGNPPFAAYISTVNNNTGTPGSSANWRLLVPGMDNMLSFTSNGSFGVPAGVTMVKVRAWGAGGGSGSSTSLAFPGGGGGAGGYGEGYYSVTPGSAIAVTVGQGSAGVAGGTTSVGSLITCVGGSHGANGSSSSVGAGGAGGAAVGGQATFNGTSGQSGIIYSSSTIEGGSGAAGFGGTISRSVGSTSVGFGGQQGSFPAGGASGCTGTGAAGGNGYVIIEW